MLVGRACGRETVSTGTGGLQIKGDEDVALYIDIGKVKKEMQRLDSTRPGHSSAIRRITYA